MCAAIETTMGSVVSGAYACKFARRASLGWAVLVWAVTGWILTCGLTGRAGAALVLETAGVAVTQNFDAIGSSPTSLSVSGLNAAGWRLSPSSTAPTTFADGTAALQVVQTAALGTGTNAFGNYNLGLDSDRAIGFLYSLGQTGPRSIMLKVTNSTGQTLNELALGWDLEEYRTGTRALPVSFFHGADGANWIAEASGDHTFPIDGPVGEPPPANPPRKSVTLSQLSLAAGASYYFRWSFGQAGQSSGAVGAGFDNFSITGSAAVVAIPEASAAGMALAASGLGALGALLRRMRREARALRDR